MFQKYELVNYQDKLYYVYRKVRESHIKDMDAISEIRDYWMCDIVLKNKINDEIVLWFLREISDAVIED